jgi:hypothetical protein
MSAGKPLLLLAALAFPAWADQIQDIRTAASEIRAVSDTKGMAGAQDAVFNCYRKSKTYDKCIAQDFILSNVAARSARDPMGVLDEMAERITQAMQRQALPLEEAKAYILLVKEHGFAAYLQ